MTNLDFEFENGRICIGGHYENSVFGDIKLSIEVPLIAILKIASAKTDNKIDDALVNMIAKALQP